MAWDLFSNRNPVYQNIRVTLYTDPRSKNRANPEGGGGRLSHLISEMFSTRLWLSSMAGTAFGIGMFIVLLHFFDTDKHYSWPLIALSFQAALFVATFIWAATRVDEEISYPLCNYPNNRDYGTCSGPSEL